MTEKSDLQVCMQVFDAWVKAGASMLDAYRFARMELTMEPAR